MDGYKTITDTDREGPLLAQVIKDPNIGFYVEDTITGFSGVITKSVQSLTENTYYVVESKHKPNIKNINPNRLRIINLSQGDSGSPVKIYIPSIL